jgi:ribosome-associated protein
MIRIGQHVAIDDREIDEAFIRAGGPGGQKVNKASTAVQLRFDAARSPSLDDRIRARLRTLAGKRMMSEGVLVITARRFRTQELNRQDATSRLIELLRQAVNPGKAADCNAANCGVRGAPSSRQEGAEPNQASPGPRRAVKDRGSTEGNDLGQGRILPISLA